MVLKALDKAIRGLEIEKAHHRIKGELAFRGLDKNELDYRFRKAEEANKAQDLIREAASEEGFDLD